MNFGKRKTIKKRKSLSDVAPKVGKKAGVSVVRVLFFAFIAVFVIGACATVGVIKGIIDTAPDIKDVNIVPNGYATFIYDVNGNQMQKLTAPTSNRMSVSLSDIPIELQHAVVAVEDERFYEHNGIDARGILRAFYVGAKNGFKFTEGASTITQQLLKNNVFTTWTQEKTLVERFRRKFQEQYLALALEKELTAEGSNPKDIILENYLNTINLGAGTYGVQAASQRYFNKNVKDLTLSECTVLAGITQNPAAFNPITHPDKNAVRRKKVLNHMKEQNYITEEQEKEVLADNVYERIANAEAETGVTKIYSYFIDELTTQVVDAFITQKGYKKEQAYQALYSGGLQIYTTQDMQIQKIADEEYENPENFPEKIDWALDWALSVKASDGKETNYSKEMLNLYFKNENPEFDLLFDAQEEGRAVVEQYKNSVVKSGDKIIAERINFTPQPQSSIVIIDQATGYVKAIVGGRGKKEASLTLNRATNTLKQPGSTFKVLAAYAPAIDEGLMGLGSIIKDEPFQYEGGRPVKNWLTNTYQGNVTLKDAIVRSINVPAVKTITEVTPARSFSMLQSFGITSLVESEKLRMANGEYGIFTDIRQPLALGGITKGVSNLELTAAYAALANGGEYIKPIFFTKIYDKDGNLLIDNTPESRRVVKESTAFLLTDAMEAVITDGQGTGRSLSLGSMPVAGKTGTTSSYNDVWFAGYTPYYTCSIWAGFDNNEKLPKSGIYRSYHKTLWKKIMSRIHEGLPVAEFVVPADVKKVSICKETGLIAVDSCESVTEYFTKENAPKKHCAGHVVEPEVPVIDPNAPPGTVPGTTPGAPGTTPDAPGTTPGTTPGTDTPPATTPNNNTTEGQQGATGGDAGATPPAQGTNQGEQPQGDAAPQQ